MGRPWESYGGIDPNEPRSNPENYYWDEGAGYIYVPPDLSLAPPAPTYNYDAAEPYGTGQPHPLEVASNYDASGNYIGPSSPYALPLGYDGTADLPDQGYVPREGDGGAGALTDYLDRANGYSAYLNGQAAPPMATDPALTQASAPWSADPLLGGAASDPGYGYDTTGGYGSYDAGYGESAGYGYDAGPGALTNPPAFGTDPTAQAQGATPYGFDPFVWAQVRNPLPPPTPLREQIMQAAGFSGPAWYPAPPPQPPGPLSYVRSRLGMQEPGKTLESKPPVPGFRFDGTPKSEPTQDLDKFVAAEDVEAWLPNLPPPPMMPPRRY